MTNGCDGGETLSTDADKINIGKRISSGLLNMTDIAKQNMNAKKRRFGKNNGMYGVHRFGEAAPMFGKSHSEETKKLISDKAKKRTSDPNWVSPVKGLPKTQKQLETTSRVNSRIFNFTLNDELIIIHNLKKYCKKLNLSYGCMIHVNAGRNKSHKGYTKYCGE